MKLSKVLQIVEEEMKVDLDMPILNKHVEHMRHRIKFRLKEEENKK